MLTSRTVLRLILNPGRAGMNKEGETLTQNGWLEEYAQVLTVAAPYEDTECPDQCGNHSSSDTAQRKTLMTFS